MNYTFSPVVSATSGKQYIWNSTFGLGQSGGTGSFTATSAGTITRSYKTQYRLNIQVSPVGGGSTNPVAGTYWHDPGFHVTVSKTPAGGYDFSHWNLDGSNAGSNTSFSVNINAPHNLTAVFSGQAITLSGESLRITPQDTVLSRGNTATITVTVFNSADSSLEGDLYIEIVGPSGYIQYDTIPVSARAKGH